MSRQFTGALIAWKSTFGFLRPDGGERADDLFVSLSALIQAGVDAR